MSRGICRYIAILVIVALAYPALEVFAVDLGKIGKSFRIEEEPFVEMMKRKLAEVDMEAERKKMESVAREKIENPTPVDGLVAATSDRTFYFDPTYVLDEDAVLPCGKILHKAGARVNPLEYMSLNRRIFFIDGRDQAQLSWLMEQLDNPLSDQKVPIEDRIILVGGSVFKVQDELAKAEKDKVFFDQHGELTSKFAIKHTPAIAQQDGLKIRIDEINLSN